MPQRPWIVMSLMLTPPVARFLADAARYRVRLAPQTVDSEVMAAVGELVRYADAGARTTRPISAGPEMLVGYPEIVARVDGNGPMVAWKTSTEVAEMLDLTTRRVLQIAARLGGVRAAPGGRWRFDRAEVEAEAARRQTR